MAAQVGQDPQSSTSPSWTLPTTINPRLVLPDRYTDLSSAAADKLKGKESDPGRMGVYVCLLDERPHLHPSLLALHRHRLNAHQIPLPPDPNNDLPTPSAQGAYLLKTIHDSSTDIDPSALHLPEVKQQDDVEMSSSVTPTRAQSIPKPPQREWFTWKFTQEEESRRKAYLPLA
ncbi:hypothetical protein IAU59_003930 [Kwoniella sp. CBS 9459]